jgi:glycosyltransferase involved in cell wall biosynthesis
VVESAPLRMCFIMEPLLGHTSWYENLHGAVSGLDGVSAQWIETSVYDSRGHLEHVPSLPSCIRASGRALLDIHRELKVQVRDVLFFNTQGPAALYQWYMLRIPTILMTDVTPRQYDRMAVLYDHDADRDGAVRFIKHQANRLNFHLARALIPWSTWTRDSLVHTYGVPLAKIHVIPPGVDVQRWRPGPRHGSRERVQLLFVGGNFRRKEGQLLLDVYRELGLHDRADLHLKTRNRVTPSPGVVVHHNLENNSLELLELYRRADVFVLPTLADCFSIASIEAMATGLPVITSALGGIPDIVDHGEMGYLIPPGDRRSLGDMLTRLIADDRLTGRFKTRLTPGQDVEISEFGTRTSGRSGLLKQAVRLWLGTAGRERIRRSHRRRPSHRDRPSTRETRLAVEPRVRQHIGERNLCYSPRYTPSTRIRTS